MTATLLLVAVILGGECGPVGQSCELEVARTMANRIGTVGFPSTLEGVLDAYYGRGEVTAASLSAAYVLLTKPEALRDGRFFFAYSDDDRRTQGWPKGDLVLRVNELAVNFSAEYPGE